MIPIVHAMSYVRTGELSGDICFICGALMIIDKSSIPIGDGMKLVNEKTGRKPWTVVCPECGREEYYISHYKNGSAYR